MQIVATTAYRDFSIMNSNLEVVKLKYEGWFSKKANARYHGQYIEIRSTNFWNNKFSIFKNEQEAGTIHFNWKGQAIIRLDELVDESQEYILKSKLGWKPHFTVLLETGELVYNLRSISKWHTLKMAYQVEKMLPELPFDEYEFLLYCGFAVNKLLANKAADS